MPLHPHARLHKTPDGLPAGYETGEHPGHWEHHHTALPADRPGDFTPVPLPGYAEAETSPGRDLLDLVTGVFTDASPPARQPQPHPDREAE